MRVSLLSTRAVVAALALAGAIAASTFLAALLPAQPARPALIVLNKSDAKASIVDLATATIVRTFPTGDGPHEVAVSPDGATAVVTNYGNQGPGNSLTVLDLAGKAAPRTISLGDWRRPHGIVWLKDGRRVLVTSELGKALLVVDVAAGTVATAIPTEQNLSHMVALAPDERTAYTANIGSGSVSKVDLAAGKTVRVKVTGKGPEAIDVSPDGKEVWAADRNLDYLTILDAATMDSLGSLPTMRFPNRLKFTLDGKRALVSNAAAGTITVYDVARRAQVATITIPFDPSKKKAEAVLGDMGNSAVPLGILMDPNGKRAWVATAALGEVVELDLATLSVTRTINAGNNPDGMAFIARLP
ncbi:MAG: beta-propeller fold lactonase family protein [Gemmatimonadaceae bacterium]|nr:beta-propeller fold lactonase family protein [Gemmatimonadaceae bacterium]